MEEIYIELFFLLFLLGITRLLYVIHKITTGFTKTGPPRTAPAKTTICIGSGGHTTEMLILLESLDFHRYRPRNYIVANTDTTSITKIIELEKSKRSIRGKDFEIGYIPRSRSVHQSYVTSVATTLCSVAYSIPIVCKVKPDLVLCNGPGTCIPVCLAAFMLKAMFVTDTRIVFIESYCRTRSFSLTGKLLVYIADNILVQWPGLKKRLKRADYIGQLM